MSVMTRPSRPAGWDTPFVSVCLYGLTAVLAVAIGILVGLEIPLLMRILKNRLEFRELVAHVLTFDYLGALGASLLFPILLVPKLGMVRSALLFGIINAGVALWSTYLFGDQLGARRLLRTSCAKPWCIRVSRRFRAPGACWCSVAVTDWRRARS